MKVLQATQGVRVRMLECLTLSFGTLLLLATMAIGDTYIAAPRTAWASGQNGDISFYPPASPVGTQINAAIWISVTTPTTYALTATTTAPTQGGCASAQPFPDVPPFLVSPPSGDGIGPYQLTFIWPEALHQGSYWLCAAPVNGIGPKAQSLQTFTVTAPIAPTASRLIPTATAQDAQTTAVPPATVSTPSSRFHGEAVLPATVIAGDIAVGIAAMVLLGALGLAWRRRIR